MDNISIESSVSSIQDSTASGFVNCSCPVHRFESTKKTFIRSESFFRDERSAAGLVGLCDKHFMFATDNLE